MVLSLRRRGPSRFEQAADGSMTLLEHVRELRNRLFVASVAVVVGLIVGWLLSKWTYDVLSGPYCSLPSSWTVNALTGQRQCSFLTLAATDGLLVKLKIALWVGLIVGAPVWLYQLWAFVAPGLHRHERRWAYVFVAIAAPLFAGGVALAYFVVGHSLAFIMEAGVFESTVQLEVTAYISFITNMMLIFGAAFEFPLVLLMLNFTGVVTARRLLSWWRTVVFLSFGFAAIATPDPGPFGMTLLALAMTALYLIAVGVAYLNDRRTGRGRELYAGLDDDAASPLEDTREAVTASGPVEAHAPVAAPQPLERRYDDMT